MTNRIATLARYTVLEALRTRLPLIAAIVLAVLVAASFFVREITIAESARFQTAFYASGARFAMVFLVALYAISAIAREFHDKVLEVALALDLPRAHYVVGKIAGFAAIAALLAVIAALPLLPLAGWEGVAQWTLALAFELTVVVALAVFCAVTFNQVMPAASIVIAFYLLARVLTAIRLIGANPVAGAGSLSHDSLRWVIEALALVVPAFDGWTRTAWLVDAAAPWAALAAIAGHGVLLVTILTAAAVFDMHRRSF